LVGLFLILCGVIMWRAKHMRNVPQAHYGQADADHHPDLDSLFSRIGR